MPGFDPRNIPMEQLMAMRLGALEELSIRYDRRDRQGNLVLLRAYEDFSEKEAAAILRRDYTTIRRWRWEGRIPSKNVGKGGVSYLGIYLADIHLFGDESPKLYE